MDRSAEAENLLPVEMQQRLIQLYQTYVAEWDTVKPQISVGLLDRENNKQISDQHLVTVQSS